MDKAIKLLIAGSVESKYSKFIKRISDVNTKAGPFDLLLCIGDFFGDNEKEYEEFINGSTELPSVSTYIVSQAPKKLLKYHPNEKSFHQGCELVDDVLFLGRSGILTTSQGLRVAYLNGSYQEDDSLEDEDMKHFTQKDINSLLLAHESASSSIIDILVTTQWPKDIFNFCNTDNIDKNVLDKINETSSAKISILARTLKPRYHFVGGLNLFYERTPFRNHKVINEASKNVTRFISIGNVANDQKQKWLYAINIIPGNTMSREELVFQPPVVTENPFLNTSLENDLKPTNPSGSQFFFDTNSNHQDSENYRKRGRNQSDRRPNKQMKVDLESCWFCLASPNVDKSLIISIGDYSYLALAKGGLTDDHLMILPIEHVRSTVEVNDSDVNAEIDKFKTSLIQFYDSMNKVPVFFERNFKTAHFQLQVIGLDKEKASDGSLKQSTEEVFAQFDFHEMSPHSDLSDVIQANVPYFFLDCPGYFKFFVRIDVKKAFFPIQIGRELLAHKSLLNCADKIDWKKCTLDPEQSKQLAVKVRQDFKPFDFTV